MVEVERGAKQDAIRAAILAFPDVTAKEIVEKVKEASKLDVSEASVAVVRGKLREEAEGKPARNGHKKPRKAKVPPQATAEISLSDLQAVKKLANEVGGMFRLTEIVTALNGLVDF